MTFGGWLTLGGRSEGRGELTEALLGAGGLHSAPDFEGERHNLQKQSKACFI